MSISINMIDLYLASIYIYLGFINTSEQDITLFPSLQGLFVSASTEQRVTYPLPRGAPQPKGTICQLEPSADPLPCD